MEKLIEGVEQTFTLLVCPHCHNEEYIPDMIQRDLFECLHVSRRGTIKAWKCRGCKKNFYTKKV